MSESFVWPNSLGHALSKGHWFGEPPEPPLPRAMETRRDPITGEILNPEQVRAGDGLAYPAEPIGYLLDWRSMFVRYVEAVVHSESYDLLDGVEWTPEEMAAVKQAAEEARKR